MITETVTIPRGDVQKLLSAASPDAALLYIFLSSGNWSEEAGKFLKGKGAGLYSMQDVIVF